MSQSGREEIVESMEAEAESPAFTMTSGM
jgi:hypothetical protein